MTLRPPAPGRSSGPMPSVILALALALGSACVGGVSPGTGTGGSGPGTGGATGTGSTSGTGGAGAQGGAPMNDSPILPARVRRLTNAEYDASAQALLGTTMVPSVKFSFPPDARQGPSNQPAGSAFTMNDAQRVDPVLADKLDAAALALVAEARGNGKLAALAPCANSATGGEACAKTFLQTFGARVYRRPLAAEELSELSVGAASVYHVGADGGTYEEGIDLLTRVLLQSAGFLYLTELGEAGAGSTFNLTANETASALSYLLTSAPADPTLLGNAASGLLATPEGREAEARRLLNLPAGRARLVRVVQEWLGITDVARREKAQTVYPEFAGVAASMEAESRDFINEVLHNSTGTLAELLTADWTVADAPLSSVYGVSSAGAGKRTSLAGVGRRGILSQGAFLSVFANNNSSHPVFRGVAILRRIACQEVPDPGAVGIVVSFPAADPSKTTRARFESHAMNAGCATCHNTIDPIGFAFENFDGMGKTRTTENNMPVDTKVTIATGSDLDGTYADSVALGNALAQSPSVKACLARQLFHSAAARSDASVHGAEQAFVDVWKQLPVDKQGHLVDVLVAFIRSPLFIQRRTP